MTNFKYTPRNNSKHEETNGIKKHVKKETCKISLGCAADHLRKHNGVYGYVVCSLITMLCVISFLHDHTSHEKQKEEGKDAISVNLAAFAPPAPTKPKTKKQRKRPKKRRHAKKVLEAIPKQTPSPIEAVKEDMEREEVVEEEQASPTQNNSDNSEANLKTLSSSSGIDDPYLRAIRNEIEKNNKYPRSAYSRRLTGEVTVKFLIKTDGEVSDVHILESSGQEILDKAAIGAVNKAKKFFPRPTESMYVVLPISYTLQFR